VNRTLVATALLSVLAVDVFAWPATITQSLIRDARRLVPRSLGLLLLEREDQVVAEAQRFPPELYQAVATDLSTGTLQPETLAALDAHAREAVDLLRQRRINEGIVRLGALLRIPADLSDPVLSAGPEGYAPGVVREYYAFVEGNLDKIPVVLDDPEALKMESRRLAVYWQGLVVRSRAQSGLIGSELFQRGRVVSHTSLDWHSPVFSVASLSYSRAVTAIAATWIALWRDVRGDVTRQPQPVILAPKDAPPEAAASPGPRPELEASRP
jgi:hypothetical protein